MPELRKWQFHREVRAGIDIVVFEDGGCVPATGVESTLFDIESDLRTRIEELEKHNKHLSTFLEEAAHAAATGKNPAKYLATEIPTELRDEIARLTTKNSMLRAKVKELETLLDPHAMTAAYMCGYEHGKNRCKCGGKLESHMEISGDEIKTYEQCDKCKGEVAK